MRKTILLRGSFVLVFLLLISLLPAYSFGEILTVKHTVKQTFGGGQSPDDARITAIAKAKRETLEEAGRYIENLTVVKNSKLEKDEIFALTASVLKAEVISQKNYHTKDAFGIGIIVNVIVDTSVLEERVKKMLQDKIHLTELKDIQKREKELLQRVAKLEDENRKLMANKQSTQKLKKEFQKASQGLTAMDWFYEALALWDGETYINNTPKDAIEYLNNSIKLQPNYSYAYYFRGSAYYDLGQYQRAIEDYNEAIRLQPDYDGFYNDRGVAYKDLGQYQRAIEDYNEAIRLEPDHVSSYINRGDAYNCLGQYQRAIEDCDKAIRLKSDTASAYLNRGRAYGYLEQYQRAIDDYNEAIRLQPDYVNAYASRGFDYVKNGNKKLGCRDLQKACALGECKMLELFKRGGICR